MGNFVQDVETQEIVQEGSYKAKLRIIVTEPHSHLRGSEISLKNLEKHTNRIEERVSKRRLSYMSVCVCMYTCVDLSLPLLFLYSRNKTEVRCDTFHSALLRFLALTLEKFEQFCEYFFFCLCFTNVDSLVSDTRFTSFTTE